MVMLEMKMLALVMSGWLCQGGYVRVIFNVSQVRGVLILVRDGIAWTHGPGRDAPAAPLRWALLVALGAMGDQVTGSMFQPLNLPRFSGHKVCSLRKDIRHATEQTTVYTGI